MNQTNLLNFKPTRPIRDIANEYVEAFCELYEPNAYMDRVYSYYLKMGAPRWKATAKLPTLTDIRALSIVIWRQGIKRNTRSRFWKYMLGMARQNPALLEQFLVVWPTTSTSSSTARLCSVKFANSWNHFLRRSPQLPRNFRRPKQIQSPFIHKPWWTVVTRQKAGVINNDHPGSSHLQDIDVHNWHDLQIIGESS